MPKNLEDQTEFDTSAAIADISADLFGQGGASENVVTDPADAGTDGASEKPSSVESDPSQQPVADKTDPATAPLSPESGQSPAAEETSPAVQEVGAPKTWSKEALADWATLPPRAQQEILKREEDFLKGISMYKEKATIGDAYDKAVEPYKPILQAENVDPVQMFQAFASNHYLLSRGTEAQKLELAANLISGYGIDFGKLATHIGNQLLTPVDPRVQALESEIKELRQGLTARQQQEAAALEDTLAKEIETFASDPSHPYFEELAADIQKLFATQQASSLQEAYDKAVYLNPVTRQKEIERLATEKAQSQSAEEQARQAKIAQATAADLALDPKSKNGTVPIGSIDDTLAETLARITSRA